VVTSIANALQNRAYAMGKSGRQAVVTLRLRSVSATSNPASNELSFETYKIV